MDNRGPRRDRGGVPRSVPALTGPRSVLVRRPEGLRYHVVLDPDAGDPISRAFAEGRGHTVCDHLVRLLLALVRPGDVVLDVGAHIGTFALPAAAAGCRVLALEPAPANAALLEAAAARNGFRELEVVAAAASDRPGPVFFHPNGPWGHVATGRSRGGAIEVPAVRLDDLVRDRGVDRVALVKLDVEGGELCALRGTARLLSRAGAAAVLYESNGHTLELAGATPNRLVGELERHDYESYIVEPDRLVRRRASELQVETVADLVAVQGGPPALPGWRVAPGLTLEERVTSLLAEATYEAPAHRAYAARALARAGEEVVSDPMVARVLGRLRNDPVPAVRADAAWSRKTAV